MSKLSSLLPSLDDVVCAPLREIMPLVDFSPSSSTSLLPYLYGGFLSHQIQITLKDLTVYPHAPLPFYPPPPPLVQTPSITVSVDRYPYELLLPILPVFFLSSMLPLPAPGRVRVRAHTAGVSNVMLHLDYCYGDEKEISNLTPILRELPPMPTEISFWKVHRLDFRGGVELVVSSGCPAISGGVVRVPAKALELLYNATDVEGGVDQIHVLPMLGKTGVDAVGARVGEEVGRWREGVVRWVDEAVWKGRGGGEEAVEKARLAWEAWWRRRTAEVDWEKVEERRRGARELVRRRTSSLAQWLKGGGEGEIVVAL
ncbi:hypothetical protein TeGR_g4686 [Tetraparma gracilis]|nr:hypothetical protein TeGR_g4686 [Tetraparma gracilis]